MQWLGTPRAQPDLLGRRHPVLLEHQVAVRPALAPSAGHGAQPAAAGQAGLAGTGLQHGLPTPEDLTGRAELPANQVATAVAGGQHRHQVPRRGRMETQEAWRRVPA